MNTAHDPQAAGPWRDATLAAAVLAVDPRGLRGIHVRARAGSVRDDWLAYATRCLGDDVPVRRIAAGSCESRLLGGLDVGLTLEAGRPVVDRGILAASDGGVLILAMAERLGASAAATVGWALDERQVRIERDGLSSTLPAGFALLALDEGRTGSTEAESEGDEVLAPALAERLALTVDLHGIGWRETEETQAFDIAGAKLRHADIAASSAMIEAFCAIGEAHGGPSMRLPLHLLRVAKALAALRGAFEVEIEDAAVALRLVLGLRLTPPQEQTEDDAPSPPDLAEAAADQPPPVEPPPAPEPGEERQTEEELQEPTAEALQEMMIAAMQAVLPSHLLSGLAPASAGRMAGGEAGKSGAERPKGTRGRTIGVAPRPPTPSARLDILATLRQAAPWQKLRLKAATEAHGSPAGKLAIRKADFRYARHHDKTGTTAIFAVDASGSAAVERLAETKGAIELLLAECYVRRDSVALVAFRGRAAETLLEPTRSLVRAKRSLAGLPGGGGTPLAGGILSALRLGTDCRRRGQSVVAVFLTDGRGNVALDGTTTRDVVTRDTEKAAKRFRASGFRSILIDTAQRPQQRAAALARDLGAEYLAMPRGRSDAVAREVGARMGT